MELRQIRYFIILAEELHFGRAARRICIAQSALSQQIRNLEEELGITLFSRTTHKVELSEMGVVFLARARRIINEVRQAETALSQTANGCYGELRIGFVEAALWDIIPALIRRFKQEYPQVTIHPYQMNTAAQMEGLKKASIQIGLVGAQIPLPGTAYHLMREEACLLAVPLWHPWAKKDQVQIENLADEPFVAIRRESGAFYFDQFIQTCMGNGFSPNIVLTTSEMQSLLAFVAGGIGIALIHESAQNIRRDLCYIPVNGIIKYPYQLLLAWKTANASVVTQNFVKIATSLFSS